MKKLISQTAKKELMKSGMSERQADLQLASLATHLSEQPVSNPEDTEALRVLEKLYIQQSNLYADLDYWLYFTSFTSVEAAYLLNNLDPDKVLIGDRVKYCLNQHYPTFEAIDRFVRIINRAILDEVFEARQDIFYWYSQANHLGLPVNPDVEKLIGDLAEKYADPSPDDQLQRFKQTWTVNTESDTRNEFYAELKKYLRKQSKAGEPRPTPAKLRKTLAQNPKLVPLFIEVDKYKDIHFYLDSSMIEQGKVAPDAWETLIGRYVVKL